MVSQEADRRNGTAPFHFIREITAKKARKYCHCSKKLIEDRSEEILNHFTVTYLNKLHSMKDTVESFDVRKQKLEDQRNELKIMIETKLRDTRESLIRDIK